MGPKSTNIDGEKSKIKVYEELTQQTIAEYVLQSFFVTAITFNMTMEHLLIRLKSRTYINSTL